MLLLLLELVLLLLLTLEHVLALMLTLMPPASWLQAAPALCTRATAPSPAIRRK